MRSFCSTGRLDGWVSRSDGDPDWCVTGDYVVVEPGSDDIRTTAEFEDCHLHVERAPPVAEGNG